MDDKTDLGDAPFRSEAVSLRSIREAGERGDTGFLIDALIEPDSMTRGTAIRYLGLTGDPVGVKPLLRLLNARDRGTRVLAVVALERIGDPRSIEPLHDLATDQTSPFLLRVNAMVALTKLGDQRATRMLEDVVMRQVSTGQETTRSEIEALRRFAAERLALVGDDVTLEKLEEARKHGNPRARRAFSRASASLRARLREDEIIRSAP